MVTYYKVGGCVRDALLGINSKDIDYAVEAESYEAMKEDLLSKGTVIFQERPEFFAIRGRHPEWGPVDFTLCRKEGFYSDNRHPDSVEIGTIYDDLSRRDFTVNAIALPETGTFIDPFHGVDDLMENILRPVGEAEDRFREDPLRMLRAVRFSIVRGFWLSENITSIFENRWDIVKTLETVSIERVYEELKQCFEKSTVDTLRFFRDYPLLKRTVFYDIGLGLTPVIRNDS
jgi:tRNA nucleotidyltransferase (CCA-adding enzyme)